VVVTQFVKVYLVADKRKTASKRHNEVLHVVDDIAFYDSLIHFFVVHTQLYTNLASLLVSYAYWMHIGTPLTHGNGRNAQLPCQPFTRLLVLNKNYFDSIKRSFAHLYLIKIEYKYNKFQCLHQRIIKKSGFERL